MSESKRVDDTISKMIVRGTLPKEGLFDITELILRSYIATYRSIQSGGGDYNVMYARRLAGSILLREKIKRGGDYTNCKEGLVYVVSNPAWKDHLKIGMALDARKRLKHYQTYDPLKLYKMDHYEFVLDRRDVEKEVLVKYLTNIESGEWIKKVKGLDVIQFVRDNFTNLDKHKEDKSMYNSIG